MKIDEHREFRGVVGTGRACTQRIGNILKRVQSHYQAVLRNAAGPRGGTDEIAHLTRSLGSLLEIAGCPQ